MPAVLITASAERDLVGIVRFIGRDKPSAASTWKDKMLQTFDTLASMPTIGENYPPLECRRLSTGSYVIYFRPTAEGITVLRVVHGSLGDP